MQRPDPKSARAIVCLALTVLFTATRAHAAPFTAGNVVVYRVGDGAGSLVNTGNPVFLDEYTTAGALVQSVALPTTASGAQAQLVASGTATSEGLLSRSADGEYLLLTGYASNLPGGASLSGTTSATVPRTVGRVDAFGGADTSTALTDFASANNPRSATSTDGTDLWVSGGAGGSRCTTFGSTTSTQLSTTVTNLRQSAVIAGQLYVSTGSGSAVRIGTVGTGTPTASGQTITNLPGFATSGSPYGFFLADLDVGVAGVDTLYVAWDDATALTKYSLVGGNWTSNGSVGVDADDYRGLTATVSGSTVTLYATRKGGSSATGGGELVTLVDSSGYNGAFSGTPTLLATAATNTAFRGVALAPEASGPTATPTDTPGGPTPTGTSTSTHTNTPTSTPVPAPAAAFQVTGAGQLIPGISAQGQVGDYVLENGCIRVLIDDIPNAHGFAETGGNIIDAARVGGEDRFASMFTYFNNTFGQQALYDTLTVVNPGGGTNTAHLRATGVDSVDPNLDIVTDYFLAPGDCHVTVVTGFTNNGTNPITQMQVGDAIQWGLTTHFAPGWDNDNRNIAGDGHDIGGVVLDADWLAGDGPGASYGYTTTAGTLEIANGSSWSDANVTYLDLPAAGGTGSYTRQFMVGSGSIASVSDIAFDIRGASTGTLSGTILESGTMAPIEAATITITTVQCLGTSGAVSYTIANSDAAGNYSATLEPGTYKVLVEAVGRTSSSCQTVVITNGGTTMLNQTLSQQGTLAWNVTDLAMQPLPAKVSILYDPLTAKREGPDLGDHHTLVGGYAILSPTGSGSTTVPPGNYQVWISRGIEYDVSVQSVSISAGATTNVNAALERVVDTTGHLSADMHVHAFNSADSGISFEIRAQQAACEGLEVVIPTDHDFHSDMATAITSTGLGSWVSTVPGNEVTTNEWGHFNGFPLTVDTMQPRNGALDHTGLLPWQIFAGLRVDVKHPVVQVNHPRAGGLGYFDLTALNPISGVSPHADFSDDFDAVEVFNGKRLYQVPTVRNDWYNLLNTGKRITGVGNTDTHVVFSQELGYPRNYLSVGTDTPASMTEAALTTAVKEQRGSFTNGPYVELTVNGSPVGSDVTDGDGTVDAAVRIQAPTWITIDTLNIVVNGEIVQTVAVPNPMTVERLDATFPVALTQDSWVAVEVTGGDCEVDTNNNCVTAGCPGRLDPVIPPQYGTEPVCPYAHTNAVFVDYDGNAQFDPPGNPTPVVEPIADVRPVDANTVNTRLDEVVTVQGTVTAPSYVFDHRHNLVYFQDESIDTVNKLSGGLVIFQQSLINPVLDIGDRVQVTGTLTMFNGLSEMEGVSIDVLASGQPVPDPVVLTVAQLRNVANAEQWEGMLVRVNDVSKADGDTWPGFGVTKNITVEDTSGPQTIEMRIDGDTDIDGTVQPSEPFDLIAVVGQFDTSPPHNGFYQLLPRQRIDIIEAADPLRILHGPWATGITTSEATIGWYTTKPGNSRVDYGTTPAYGAFVTNGSSVHSHSMLLTGLLLDTIYHYQVTSNGVVSEDGTFSTLPEDTPTPSPTSTDIDTSTPTATITPTVTSSATNTSSATATATATSSSPPAASPTPTSALPSCAVAPVSGCAASSKRILKIRNSGTASANQVLFKWIGGSADVADFGDPTAATGYALCVYVDGALIMEPAVVGSANWSSTGSGFKYTNASTNADGMFKLLLKSGNGKAKILAKGKGANLTVPGLPIGATSEVRVQLVKDGASGSECWEASFTPPFKSDETPIFKDKEP